MAQRLVAVEEQWRPRDVDRVHIRWRGVRPVRTETTPGLSLPRAREAATRLLQLGMLRGEVVFRGILRRPSWIIFAWRGPDEWGVPPRDPWVSPVIGDHGTRVRVVYGEERVTKRRVLAVTADDVEYVDAAGKTGTTTREAWRMWGRTATWTTT